MSEPMDLDELERRHYVLRNSVPTVTLMKGGSRAVLSEDDRNMIELLKRSGYRIVENDKKGGRS
jgi:hypothetical protein